MSGVILDRHIIIGLIVSGPYAKKIRQIWDPALIESPEMAKIAQWLLDYHERYGQAPGHDIEQLYLTALDKGEMGKAEAELIEDTLRGVSADALRVGNEVKPDFLFDQTAEFLKKRALTRHTEIISALIERGRLDEAEQAARSFRPLYVDAEESLAAITPRQVVWLWPDRIPLGKLTILAGAPDLGKSTVLCDIAARVSSGTDWPDGARARKRAVLVGSAEDDHDDTVVPRLMAAGADLTLCHAIGAEAASIDALCVDIDRKAESLRARGQIVGLVTIDPLASYLGKVDSHNDSQVRVALRPLRDVASRHRIAIVALRHTRKAGSGSAMDQVSGSLAFVASARAAFLITPDREDETKRLLIPLKGNLTPTKTGLAYHIVPADVSLRSRHGTVKTSVPRIEWLSEVVSMSADEAMAAARERHTKVEDVKEWLTDILADGPLPMKTVEETAGRAGYSMMTVRRAADAIGVKKDKGGYQGSWQWSMPTRH
jgi:hypothetical protein